MKDILRYFPGKIQNILNEEIEEKYNMDKKSIKEIFTKKRF